MAAHFDTATPKGQYDAPSEVGCQRDRLNQMEKNGKAVHGDVPGVRFVEYREGSRVLPLSIAFFQARAHERGDLAAICGVHSAAPSSFWGWVLFMYPLKQVRGRRGGDVLLASLPIAQGGADQIGDDDAASPKLIDPVGVFFGQADVEKSGHERRLRRGCLYVNGNVFTSRCAMGGGWGG